MLQKCFEDCVLEHSKVSLAFLTCPSGGFFHSFCFQPPTLLVKESENVPKRTCGLRFERISTLGRLQGSRWNCRGEE